MIVMKFGGTSVGNAESIKTVADIIKSNIDKKPIVVVSAIASITDKLIKTANLAFSSKNYLLEYESIKDKHYKVIEELGLDYNLIGEELKELKELLYRIYRIREITTEILDHVQSFGERMSSKILASYLTNMGLKAEAHNAYDLGLVTNEKFGCAEPLEESEENLRKHLKDKEALPIVTGFIAKTKAGQITTLGRGGSDYTAALIGAALNVDRIEIWTDVDGIMSADPKIVKEAKLIERLSFAEASELAYFGAKVLHPKTILPAMKKNIPVVVLNTHNRLSKGTVIVRECDDKRIKGIAFKKDICLVNIVSARMLNAHGFLARLFEIFAKYEKVVDVVTTSEVSVSLTIDDENNMDEVLNSLDKIGKVKFEKNKAIVCVVGEEIGTNCKIVGKIFNTLSNNDLAVEMISQGASKINVTFVIDSSNVEKTVQILHKELFE